VRGKRSGEREGRGVGEKGREVREEGGGRRKNGWEEREGGETIRCDYLNDV
jgi:hypothetical protein